MKIFKEIIREKFCGHIIISDVVPATEKEINEAKLLFKNTGKCNHEFIIDESGWMYDIRSCAICKHGLGTV